MSTSLRRWSGLVLAVVPVLAGGALQLAGFPLVGTQLNGRTVVYYVSGVLVALVILSMAGVILMAWPGREDSNE